MEIKILDIFWLMIAQSLIIGLIVIFSAFATGWLVFRAKRDSHERLFAPKVKKRTGPIHKDPFADTKEDDPISDIIKKQNSLFGEAFVKDNLKGDKKS